MDTIEEPQEEMILSRLNAKRQNIGLRTFHSSATRLWDETELSLIDISSQTRFLRDLQRKMIHVFKICCSATKLHYLTVWSYGLGNP